MTEPRLLITGGVMMRYEGSKVNARVVSHERYQRMLEKFYNCKNYATEEEFKRAMNIVVAEKE